MESYMCDLLVTCWLLATATKNPRGDRQQDLAATPAESVLRMLSETSDAQRTCLLVCAGCRRFVLEVEKSNISERARERERERKRESASDRKRERGKKREKESERPLSCTSWQSYKFSAFSVCVYVSTRAGTRERERKSARENDLRLDLHFLLACFINKRGRESEGGKNACWYCATISVPGRAIFWYSATLPVHGMQGRLPQRFPSMECRGVCMAFHCHRSQNVQR